MTDYFFIVGEMWEEVAGQSRRVLAYVFFYPLALPLLAVVFLLHLIFWPVHWLDKKLDFRKENKS
ncbi:hypothetical protein NO1_1941 [Candidatus Termititenax aidoneus]|uniref:Uncharacterized protein n=1 Tax=Termititenax aidoneus TaxID=2218524 RepID=A0A388TE74_TERA1|nr:hypothetical protein NO1_1941 [Candidatus Termititenax aidoneus]